MLLPRILLQRINCFVLLAPSLLILSYFFSTAELLVISFRPRSFVLVVFVPSSNNNNVKSPVVTLADGHQQAIEGVLSSLPVRVASFQESLDFTVTDLQGFDAILGMPWLQRHNPTIDWCEQTISFIDRNKKHHVLRSAGTESRNTRAARPSCNQPPSSVRSAPSLNLISHKELVQDHRSGALEFACLIWPELPSS